MPITVVCTQEFLGSLSLLQPSWQALELMPTVCTLPVGCDVGAEVKLPACFYPGGKGRETGKGFTGPSRHQLVSVSAIVHSASNATCCSWETQVGICLGTAGSSSDFFRFSVSQRTDVFKAVRTPAGHRKTYKDP